jgi:hypothetical protein
MATRRVGIDMPLSRKQVIAALTKDYESSSSDSNHSLKKQCDRLANFAYIALKHLEDNNMQDFVLLRHDDLRGWWKEHKESLRQAELAREAKLRRAELRERALSRLSDEEKEALGLKKR